MSVESLTYCESFCCLSSSWEDIDIRYSSTGPIYENTWDKETNDLYNREPWYVISLKASSLFVSLPIVHIVGTFINLSRMFIHPLMILKDQVFTQESFSLKNTVITIVEVELNNLYKIVSAPFYSLALQAICLFTIPFPLEGRKYYAIVEKSWCQNIPTKGDIRHIINNDNDSTSALATIFRALLDYKNECTFYSAYCFQPVAIKS